MDYFDIQEKKEKEALEEKKYQEIYQKQMKIVRIIMLVCFGPIGFIFLVIGLGAFVSGSDDPDISIMAATFSGMGLLFILLGVILFFCIPKKGNYTRYKKNIERFGGVNIFDMKLRMELLEDKVQKLEEQNYNLQKQVEDLERRNSPNR